MRKFSSILLSILVMLWQIPSAWGLQKITIADNQTRSAKVAAKDVTRIFVENDRIAFVRGTMGSYTTDNDNNQGIVYIKPTAIYQTAPFTVFITTELGHNFTLLLVPVDMPADTIELKSASSAHAPAIHWEESLPYTNTLTHLMSDMINETSPEGYAVVSINKTRPTSLGNVATLQLLTSYIGVHLRGDIFLIKNRLSKPLYLSETEFYQSGTRAIALENTTVPALGQTLLYRVTSQ